jgi:hypothetical protein
MRLYKAIFVILLFFNSISAQHIGISFSKTWTDNYELENPNGFSINISQVFIDKFEVQFEYSKFENRREFFGHLIGGFLPVPPSPQDTRENVQSESRLQVYDISVKYFLLQLDELSIAFGAGLSLNKMDGRRVGTESDRTAPLFDEDSFGISGIFYLESRAVRALPVTLYLTIQKKQISSGNQATDIETPFSSSLDTWVLQTGIKFKF